MQILQVTPHYYPEHQFGGPPRKIHGLSRALVRLGHRVTVLAMDSRHRGRSERMTMDGVTVQYLPWLGWGTRQMPCRSRLLLEAVGEADVVQGYGLYTLIVPLAFRAARRTGKPVLIEPLGMYKPKVRRQCIKRLFHAAFTHRMFRQAQRVIANSTAEAAEFTGAVPLEKIFVRRNGIDIGEFQQLPAPDRFRSHAGIAEGERVALYLGRISPIKNLEMLVEAFAAAQMGAWTLVLAGPQEDPGYADALRSQVTRHQLGQRVILPGPVYDDLKLSALAAADLFVMPSHSESFGNAVAEAVAAGLTVLVTEGCGIAPAVHARAGLAVPCTTEAITQGLKRLSEPGEREQVSRQRGEVVRELSWEEPARLMDGLYSELKGLK